LPFFGSSKQSMLPPDIVQRMEFYGRREFAPQESSPDAASRVNELVYQRLYPVASAAPDAFIAALAVAVLPASGWAIYGGQRCVRDLLDARVKHPDYVAMVDAAMQFLRSQGYGLMHVAPVEQEIWRELHPGEQW
jgi:hypothetical protein